MKNIKSNLIFFSLFLFSVNLVAQNEITEGVIKMEISEVNSDDQQIAAQLEMMKGTETNYHFNKDKYLVTANMMGGMITMKNLFNVSDEQLTILFDVMGQKMMVESSKEERKAKEEEQMEAMEGMEVVYDKEDTKEILGYKCHKAIIKGNDDVPMSFEMYVSPELKATNKMIQGLQAFDIEGFPMEFVMDMGKMSMTYTTTEIAKEVDAAVFEIDTNGYKKMTFDEFQEQMGAMGGGMGF